MFELSITANRDAVAFDAEQLSEYAAGMVRHLDAHPENLRLATWYRLERADADPHPGVQEINQHRLDAIAEAQAAGRIRGDLAPTEVLVLLQALVAAWQTMNPELAQSARAVDATRRAEVIAEAIVALLAPC